MIPVTVLSSAAMLMDQKKWIHCLKELISHGEIVSRACEYYDKCIRG